MIAAGLTILQVAANPLAAELGPPAGAHFRLTFSQAFNSLGTTIAPYLVSSLLLAGGIFAVVEGAAPTAAARTESLQHIGLAFLIIADSSRFVPVHLEAAPRLEAAAPPPSAAQDSAITRALGSRWALRAQGPSFCMSVPRCLSAAI